MRARGTIIHYMYIWHCLIMYIVYETYYVKNVLEIIKNFRFNLVCCTIKITEFIHYHFHRIINITLFLLFLFYFSVKNNKLNK